VKESLLDATTVTQSGMHGEVVEANGHHGEKQNDKHNKHGEPKLATAEGHAKAAQILVGDEIAVDEESEGEVKGDAPPDDNVIKHGPVGRIQRYL